MKTESEIQDVIDWIDGVTDVEPCDDLPYIEDIMAFQQALLWVTLNFGGKNDLCQ